MPTLRPRTPGAPKKTAQSEPERLSLRWFIIVTAGIGSYLLGAAADPVVGVGLACVVMTLLHLILE